LPPRPWRIIAETGSLLPEGVHLGQLLRGMLEVAVNDSAAVPAGGLQSGEDSGLLSKIPGKADTPHTLIGLGSTADLLPGAVGGAVVHEHQLIGNVCPAQDFPNALGGEADELFLVIGGNYYRQHRLHPLFGFEK
jgi:hypothetical protein